MASIYRQKGRKRYQISYKDEAGRRVTVAGYRDKEATKALANRLERNAERARAGLPVENEARRHQNILELREQYLSELTRKGRTQVHIKEQRRLLGTTFDECGWERLSQIRPDRMAVFLNEMQPAVSSRTLNSYRDALSSFLQFCVRQRWIEENPLKDFPKAKGKKPKPRRAYTIEELYRLQFGSRHAALYVIAATSGLRKSELRQLQRRDFSFEPARWHLRPEITKGKRTDVLPMAPEAAEIMSRITKDLAPTDRVFPVIPRTQTLHRDIKNAGLQRIDTTGRQLDFHSLRYTFCTILAKHLPIQQVRLLMRHRDIRQTVNLYMDLGLTDVADSLAKLPPLLDNGVVPDQTKQQQQPKKED